jgi:hypothetical protein
MLHGQVSSGSQSATSEGLPSIALQRQEQAIQGSFLPRASNLNSEGLALAVVTKTVASIIS